MHFEQEIDGILYSTHFTEQDIEKSIDRQMVIFHDEFNFTDEENDPVREIIRDFAKNLNREKEFILVVKRDGNLIGSVSFVGEDYNVGRLRFVYLEKEERKKGIGKKMLSIAIDLAKRFGYTHLYLSTYNILTDARHTYASLGFKKTKETPAQYVSQDIMDEIWEMDI